MNKNQSRQRKKAHSRAISSIAEISKYDNESYRKNNITHGGTYLTATPKVEGDCTSQVVKGLLSGDVLTFPTKDAKTGSLTAQSVL
jgi:hypothetical protein